MIAKKDRIVVTFYTTTVAMKMEDVCKACGAEGRIIPVPGFISADCGLCQLCSHCHFPNCTFGRY